MSLAQLLSAHQRTQTQALLATGFPKLPCARALPLNFGSAGRDMLSQWLCAVTPMVATVRSPSDFGAVQLALSFAGIVRLRPDLPSDRFDLAFRMSMSDAARSRLLGDDQPGARRGDRLAWSDGAGANSAQLLLLLYAPSGQALDRLAKSLPALPAGACFHDPIDLRLSAEPNPPAITEGWRPFREHFGFADGLSQPVPHGEGSSTPRDRWHGVALGDLLLGHADTYGAPFGQPFVDDSLSGAEHLATLDGRRSFSANGTYLVARQLWQDVPGFWRSVRQQSECLAAAAGPARGVAGQAWLAEKIVGRTLDGHVLQPGGPLTPRLDARGDPRPDNGFGFAQTDPHGLGCPLGAHIRRSNPRDAGAKLKDSQKSRERVLAAVNNHRILRRGRAYGPWLAFDRRADPPPRDDHADRGLLFIALCADIARQFETIQQNWILNPFFAGLRDETDPLVGPPGRASIALGVSRRLVRVERYVRLVGGGYFFLPSIGALKFLGCADAC